MNDLINREELLNHLNKILDHEYTMGNYHGDSVASDCIEAVEQMPSVDAVSTESEFKRIAIQRGYVQVVKCKDCKHKNSWMWDSIYGYMICNKSKMKVNNETQFCPYGEEWAVTVGERRNDAEADTANA